MKMKKRGSKDEYTSLDDHTKIALLTKMLEATMGYMPAHKLIDDTYAIYTKEKNISKEQ